MNIQLCPIKLSVLCLFTLRSFHLLSTQKLLLLQTNHISSFTFKFLNSIKNLQVNFNKIEIWLKQCQLKKKIKSTHIIFTMRWDDCPPVTFSGTQLNKTNNKNISSSIFIYLWPSKPSEKNLEFNLHICINRLVIWPTFLTHAEQQTACIQDDSLTKLFVYKVVL